MNSSVVTATVTGIFLAIILSVFLFFTATVDTGSVGVVTNFGKITGEVLDPGWHIVGPVDHVNQMNCRTLNNQFDTDCVSSDQQKIPIVIAVQMHLIKENAVKVFSQFGENYLDQAMPKINDALKTETAKYAVADIMANRDNIRMAALKEARARLEGFVEVDDISLVNIDFSDEYKKAIEAKQVAQQRAEQAKYELQQAEVEAQKKIATAKGEAESIQLTGDALAKNPAVAQLKLIEKWDGTTPTTLVVNGSGANGATSVILPMPTPAPAK